MPVDIGLKYDERIGVVHILNTLLADFYTIYTTVWSYHWNLTGPFFGPLHTMFGEEYEAVQTMIDNIAERSRALGGRPDGSLSSIVKRTRLKENQGEFPSAEEMVTNLLADYEQLVRFARKDERLCDGKYHDRVTSNFIMNLVEKLEKFSWKLRATSKKG